MATKTKTKRRTPEEILEADLVVLAGHEARVDAAKIRIHNREVQAREKALAAKRKALVKGIAAVLLNAKVYDLVAVERAYDQFVPRKEEA